MIPIDQKAFAAGEGTAGKGEKMKLLLGIAALFGADYASKQYVEEHFKEKKEKKYCRDHLILRKYYNKGLALNSLEKRPKLAIGLSATALGYLIGRHLPEVRKKKKNHFLRAGFVMVTAGALGNLYDHIFRGRVIDFISVNLPKCKKISRAVFNLADVFVLTGGVLMILGILFGGKASCGDEDGCKGKCRKKCKVAVTEDRK